MRLDLGFLVRGGSELQDMVVTISETISCFVFAEIFWRKTVSEKSEIGKGVVIFILTPDSLFLHQNCFYFFVCSIHLVHNFTEV